MSRSEAKNGVCGLEQKACRLHYDLDLYPFSPESVRDG